MSRRVPRVAVYGLVLATTLITAFTVPHDAPAQTGTCIKLGSTVIPITPGLDLQLLKLQGGVIVDCPSTQPPPKLPLPKLPLPTETTPAPPPTTPTTPSKPQSLGPKPESGPGAKRGGGPTAGGDGAKGTDKTRNGLGADGTGGGAGGRRLRFELKRRAGGHKRRTPTPDALPPLGALRNPDGSPTPSNPGFVDALPGPSFATGVPNFVIRKFRVPPFLLPIYQAAGIQYGVRWEVLAAINEIETDYGRNLNVSSAGALGWMQFIPSSWKMWGVDANRDGVKDPYNPVDAIFGAARYLKAAGYSEDPRKAVFAYNHAGWYVDSVMLRARLIAGVPSDVIGSLTGLTEGRFPIAARTRYADDQSERASKHAKVGENAANIVASDDRRQQIALFSREGAPVVATNDGVVKRIGQSKQLGRYAVLQDVYGNRYTYAGLGSVERFYAVPKRDGAAADGANTAKALRANRADGSPRGPATAGRQPEAKRPAAAKSSASKDSADAPANPQPSAALPVKQRLFAHPALPGAREAGGLEQQLDSRTERGDGFETYRNYFARPLGTTGENVSLRRLRPGSHVIGGTVLGRVGRPVAGKAPHLNFAIRPAGKGTPKIDPKPIIDGWKLLEATQIYRASGRNVLDGDGADGLSIGQILLLPKDLLARRVLSDESVQIYPDGRGDIRSGQIDRRVLATLEFLAASGLRPTVSSLRGNHGFLTTSGNVSEHSSGNAVDIASVNGTPIAGHQDPGGITEQTVRRLMTLQGTMRPHQIISLLDFGDNTLSLPDHADHIHVGFRPRFGENRKLGRQAMAVLEPGQWSDLVDQLGKIDNPVVPTKASKYAIPSNRASTVHEGE